MTTTDRMVVVTFPPESGTRRVEAVRLERAGITASPWDFTLYPAEFRAGVEIIRYDGLPGARHLLAAARRVPGRNFGPFLLCDTYPTQRSILPLATSAAVHVDGEKPRALVAGIELDQPFDRSRRPLWWGQDGGMWVTGGGKPLPVYDPLPDDPCSWRTIDIRAPYRVFVAVVPAGRWHPDHHIVEDPETGRRLKWPRHFALSPAVPFKVLEAVAKLDLVP